VIGTNVHLFTATAVIIILSMGSLPLGDSGSALAQSSDVTLNKTVIFDTFVIDLDDDGVLNGFDFDRQVINGTNEDLMKQFPQVLKSAHELAGNMTKKEVAFIDFETGNATVLPYQNVTTQAYMDEFSNSLKQMDKVRDPSSHRCWIMYPDGEGRDIHVHRCW
jgi:hypothetical protein